MKKFITPSYTFIPGASGVGTLNLSGIANFNVKYLVAVINQTRGTLVYSTGTTDYRYTNVTGTTLTLFANTSAMSGTDVLQVIYEVEEKTQHAVVLDAASTNIPASANNPLEIVTVTASRISAIDWSDEIGEIIGVYTGAVGSEVLQAVTSFGGGRMIVDIPAGQRVAVKNMKNAAITSGYATINLIG